ncbi:MAG: hypothetical protein KDC46_15455 [Thermoleophilia bacterium]|nr:hypothetical protein [Thermoleophilia bacterium]
MTEQLPASPDPPARRIAMVVTALVATNAAGGAIYGIAGADAVPDEWLDGSPFDSYLLPALFLGLVVGGLHAIASLWLARRDPRARRATLLAGTVLVLWIAAQVAIIGYVSPLQPVMFLTGLAEAWLALLLAAERFVPAATPSRARSRSPRS